MRVGEAFSGKDTDVRLDCIRSKAWTSSANTSFQFPISWSMAPIRLSPPCQAHSSSSAVRENFQWNSSRGPQCPEPDSSSCPDRRLHARRRLWKVSRRMPGCSTGSRADASGSGRRLRDEIRLSQRGARKGPGPASRNDLPFGEVEEPGEEQVPGVEQCHRRLTRARVPVVRVDLPVVAAGQGEIELNASFIWQLHATR